jgi:hypothetical protein
MSGGILVSSSKLVAGSLYETADSPLLRNPLILHPCSPNIDKFFVFKNSWRGLLTAKLNILELAPHPSII